MSAASAIGELHAGASLFDAGETMLRLVDCRPGLSLAAGSRPRAHAETYADAVAVLGDFGAYGLALQHAGDMFSSPAAAPAGG